MTWIGCDWDDCYRPVLSGLASIYFWWLIPWIADPIRSGPATPFQNSDLTRKSDALGFHYPVYVEGVHVCKVP